MWGLSHDVLTAFDPAEHGGEVQLLLPFPSASAETTEPCWSDANRAAALLIDAAPTWPLGLACLIGPAGSGKSFLTRRLLDHPHVLSTRRELAAAALSIDLAPGEVVVVEDFDRMLKDADNRKAGKDGAHVGVEPAAPAHQALETAAFHLANRVAACDARLIFTARTPPSEWGVRLRDLSSRLSGAAQARISAPDHALMTAVLGRRFAERGLRPTSETITALARRLEPRFETADALAARLDRLSAVSQQRITAALARRLLQRAVSKTSAERV